MQTGGSLIETFGPVGANPDGAPRPRFLAIRKKFLVAILPVRTCRRQPPFEARDNEIVRWVAILAGVLSLKGADSGLYPSDYALRRVRFEPSGFGRYLPLPRTDRIRPADLPLLAEGVRRALVLDGYKDASVEAQLAPVARRKADVIVRVRSGERWVVGEVRFSGENELRQALRSLRPRVIFPGVWKSRPPFSYEAIAEDLERLRSFYVARGWLRARVLLDRVEFRKGGAIVTIRSEPGPRYELGAAWLPDGRSVPGRDLCRCLLAEHGRALREGRLDFRARIVAERTGDGSMDLRLVTEPGPVYVARRIEFEGNRSISDAALRKAFLLEEGAPLDAQRLARSLERLERFGIFAPLSPDSVRIERDSALRVADIRITLREQKSRRWLVSGPVGPPRLGGPLRAEVAMRLPGWGRGIAEASTYYASATLTALYVPFLMVPGAPSPLAPLLAIRRPLIPGQEWTSGLLLSPQLGWRGAVFSYAAAQWSNRMETLVRGRPAQPPLVVPILLGERAANTLLCEPSESRWSWLRTVALMGLNALAGGV